MRLFVLMVIGLSFWAHNIAEVWGGMVDVVNAGRNTAPWVEGAKNINRIHNADCAPYREFVALLGKPISDATEQELGQVLGLSKGVYVDSATAKELKTIMLGVETICQTAARVAETLPGNDIK